MNRFHAEALSYICRSLSLAKRGVILCSFLLALTNFAFGQEIKSESLPAEKTIEREIAGTETHRYKISLKANEFFQVRVEQKGVDVALKLLDAAGATLATMDSPNGTNGPEVLLYVAEKAGKDFTLEVSGFDPEGKMGKYDIFREAFKVATDAEKKRIHTQINAKKLFDEAEALRKSSNKEFRHNTVAKYEQASILYKEIGDHFAEGNSLLNAGLILSDFGEKQSALKTLGLSSAAFGKIDDWLLQARTLVVMARISFGLKEQAAALKFFDQALNLPIGDRAAEADIREELAKVHGFIGNKNLKLEQLRLVVDLWKALGDKSKEANSIRILGATYMETGEVEKGKTFLNQALSLSSSIGNKSIQAETIRGLAQTIYYEAEKKGIGYSEADANRAVLMLKDALTLSREANDKELQSSILTTIGNNFSSMNKPLQAIHYYEEALLVDRSSGFDAGIGASLNFIGRIYASLDLWEKALERLNEALLVYQKAGFRRGEAGVLLDIGSVYSSLGANERAIEFCEKAKTINGDNAFDHASIDRIAGIYFRARDWDRSLEYYKKLLTFERDLRNKGINLSNIAAAYEGKKDFEKAYDFYKQAIETHRKVGDKSGEAGSLTGIADLLVRSGEAQEAVKFYDRALAIFRAGGEKERETRTLGLMMSCWTSLKQPKLAAYYGKQAINRIQDRRQSITTLDKGLQKSYLALVEPAYRQLADVLIEDGKFAQAEQVLAMLKDEEYFEFVRRDAGEVGKLDARVPLNEKEKALIARYSVLADKVTEIGQEFGKLDDKKRMLSRNEQTLSPEDQKRYDEIEKQLSDANAAFQLFLTKELVAEIGKEKAAGIEIDRNLQDKLRKWGDGTVALYTVAGEDRYRVILTTPKVQIDGKTEIKISDLNKKVFAFRAALQNPSIDPRPIGKELYDILIKPIEKELKAANAKTLVWSLDGTLRYIPLAALSPDGKRYLAEDFQNVIITPKTRDDLTNSNTNWTALGMGVSDAQTVTNPGDASQKIPFSALPGTERELLSIIKDGRKKDETGVLLGQRFMNKDFTKLAFKDSLAKETDDGKAQFNLVHIASHFSLGSNWSNSFLLLGNGEVLTLEEMNNSPSFSFGDVELVTLSACNTGFADDSNGKEIDSLASVIQTKSGKAVLATLWPVADESTSLLMSEFYLIKNESPKISKAEAINLAQKAMISGKIKPAVKTGASRSDIIVFEGENETTKFVTDPTRPFAHPYYWAPFILIGNWR